MAMGGIGTVGVTPAVVRGRVGSVGASDGQTATGILSGRVSSIGHPAGSGPGAGAAVGAGTGPASGSGAGASAGMGGGGPVGSFGAGGLSGGTRTASFGAGRGVGKGSADAAAALAAAAVAEGAYGGAPLAGVSVSPSAGLRMGGAATSRAVTPPPFSDAHAVSPPNAFGPPGAHGGSVRVQSTGRVTPRAPAGEGGGGSGLGSSVAYPFAVHGARSTATPPAAEGGPHTT